MEQTQDYNRRHAVANRQSLADDPFLYGVLTTGIYCRPECPSKAARAENLRFFDTATAARQAGYRPCKRCKPDDPDTPDLTSVIIAACHLLADSEAPGLEDLAATAGYSPAHFHKVFKRETGLTPKAFHQAWRQDRLQDALKAGQTVTRALFDAGFDSAAQGYASTRAQTGLTPASFRQKGAKLTMRYSIRPCHLGLIAVTGSEKGICRITLGDDAAQLRQDILDRFAAATELQHADRDFDQWLDQLLSWLDKPVGKLDLPLDIRGTAFRQKVWTALRDIPPGQQVRYQDVARMIGQPSASRAVANACASNDLALVIPCHRVVRKDGSPGGYRWGTARKQALLAKEKPE